MMLKVLDQGVQNHIGLGLISRLGKWCAIVQPMSSIRPLCYPGLRAAGATSMWTPVRSSHPEGQKIARENKFLENQYKVRQITHARKCGQVANETAAFPATDQIWDGLDDPRSAAEPGWPATYDR